MPSQPSLVFDLFVISSGTQTICKRDGIAVLVVTLSCALCLSPPSSMKSAYFPSFHAQPSASCPSLKHPGAPEYLPVVWQPESYPPGGGVPAVKEQNGDGARSAVFWHDGQPDGRWWGPFQPSPHFPHTDRQRRHAAGILHVRRGSGTPG